MRAAKVQKISADDPKDFPKLLPIRPGSDPSVLDNKDLDDLNLDVKKDRKPSEKSLNLGEVFEAAYDPVTLGGMLKEARIKAGLTKLQVAAAADLPDKTVLRIERGETSPQFSTIEKYCSAIGLKPFIGLVNAR